MLKWLAGAASAALFSVSFAQAFEAQHGPLMLLAQTETAAPAEVDEALQKAGNQTTGTIKELNPSARQMILEDGQNFTIDEAVDWEGLNLDVGQQVLVTFEEDTRVASSVQAAGALPDELPADPPTGEGTTTTN